MNRLGASPNKVRRSPLAITTALLAAATLLAACGGGGGTSVSSGGSGSGATTSCGGMSTNTTSGHSVPLVVDGVCGGVNQAYVTLQVCIPGSTSACRTIDHIWVDTGSTGLRIVDSAMLLGLPAAGPQGGNVVASCGQFVSGYIWGAVRLADVSIGGESASSVPIQVIGDPGLPAAPSTCASAGQDFGTVSKLSANGILGIGLTQQDCGAGCAAGIAAPPGWYYTCPGGNCNPAFVATGLQLQNIVGRFAVDNNGVQLQLPALSAAGAATATGSLVFGIGTQADNGLGAATIFAADPNPANASTTYLDLSTIFNSTTFPQSYIDSGSNAWFFDDSALTACGATQPTGFFCQSASGLTATMRSFNGGNGFTYTFNVADASALNGSNNAFNDLAGPASGNGQTGVTFDWGLPFFYGRSVYFAIENQNIGGTVGPFYAATTP